MTPETAVPLLLERVRSDAHVEIELRLALDRWSTEELVEALWHLDAMDREIAKGLDAIGRLNRRGGEVTDTAVRKWRHQMDLVSEPPPRVDRQQLCQLHAQGANAREIADLLGCTWRTAQQILWEEGLSTEGGRRSLLRPE